MSLVVGLDSALDHVRGSVATQQIAGAVAMVARAGEVVQLASVGHQDIEAGLPMQPDTIFRIASMTKPIVSVAALMLVEAGRIDLDDPVARTIPAFARTKVFAEDGRWPPPTRGRRSADHGPRPVDPHVGVGRRRADPRPARRLPAPNPTTTTWPSSAPSRRSPPRPPTRGVDWVYGWSHDVLGRVIEIAADRPLDEFLETSIFGPLGMVDTGFQVGPEKVGRLAVAYDRADGRLRRSGRPRGRRCRLAGPPHPPVGRRRLRVDDLRLLAIPAHARAGRRARRRSPAGARDGRRHDPESQLPPDLVPIQIEDHRLPRRGLRPGVGVIAGPGGDGTGRIRSGPTPGLEGGARPSASTR